MQPIQLFELASRQAHWLSVRQSVVAGNIANADTPGYVARDVEPFNAVLETVASSSVNRPSPGGALGTSTGTGATATTVALTSTGADVSLEAELMKAGEVRRDFQLTTGVVKSFHRMMLMTVRA